MAMPLDLLWLTIPTYVVLQVVALLRPSGGSRVIDAAPTRGQSDEFAEGSIRRLREWPRSPGVFCDDRQSRDPGESPKSGD